MHVWDEDGNEYIDLISGLGAITVGYCNRHVNTAAIAQLSEGISFSLPNKLEYLLAKKLTELVPSTEMWKFTKTGSDACTMAVKCARAYTGRSKVIAYGYHGWHDWYSILNDKKAGIPTHTGWDIRKGLYNAIDFAELRTYQYAAVILEPMVFDYPDKVFFKQLVDTCKETKTVLIFDEVVTGGRFENFVAQNLFKVEPDLTVLSKGIANGFPLAAVGGKKSIMSVFERDDFFASTTFGGECVSLAAAMATTEILKTAIPQMIRNGLEIQDVFNRLYHDATCKGYPTRLTFDFPSKEHKALFMQEMCKQGVLIGYSNFIMADCTMSDMQQIFSALGCTRAAMEKYWHEPIKGLEGKMPVEVFRMR